jgi:sugar phosphate isomerase/epimerase
MKRSDIALDFLTALEFDAVAFVEFAARHEIYKVGLMVQPFTAFRYFNLLGDTGSRRRLLRACRETGVAVDMVEPFFFDAAIDPQDLRPAFETGALLGAKWVNLIARDSDMARMGDNFTAASELAAEYGMSSLTEISKRGTLRKLEDSVAFLKASGNTHMRIELDSLHFFRLDGDVADITKYASWIARAQICDGTATLSEEEQWTEARDHRLPPGDGAFDLSGFLNALPADINVGIEVPNRDMSPDERVTRSLDGIARLTELT